MYRWGIVVDVRVWGYCCTTVCIVCEVSQTNRDDCIWGDMRCKRRTSIHEMKEQQQMKCQSIQWNGVGEGLWHRHQGWVTVCHVIKNGYKWRVRVFHVIWLGRSAGDWVHLYWFTMQQKLSWENVWYEGLRISSTCMDTTIYAEQMIKVHDVTIYIYISLSNVCMLAMAPSWATTLYVHYDNII